MNKVYCVGGIYGTAYFNTQEEADRFRAIIQYPYNTFELDGTTECNRLSDQNEQVNVLLSSLFNVTGEAEVRDYFEQNPLTAADSGDRDGGRSYS